MAKKQQEIIIPTADAIASLKSYHERVIFLVSAARMAIRFKGDATTLKSLQDALSQVEKYLNQ